MSARIVVPFSRMICCTVVGLAAAGWPGAMAHGAVRDRTDPGLYEAALDSWRDRIASSGLGSDPSPLVPVEGESDEARSQAVAVFHVAPSGNGDGSSWESAFGTLEAALAAAAPLAGSPVQIWVASGTYIPGGMGGSRTNSFVLTDGVELLGGFAGTELDASQRDPGNNPTVLSGDRGLPLVAADNNYRIVRFEGAFMEAAIDGFIIRDGMADGTGDNGCGAAVWVKWGSINIRNCLFLSNQSIDEGGALYTTGSVGVVTVERSVFTGNGAETGGAAALKNGGTMRECSFMANNATFGGAISIASATLVDTCEFSDNFALEGGAISAQAGTLRVRWSTLDSNAAGTGGHIRVNGGADHVITNSTMINGIATDGAAVYATGRTTIVNSLLAWNDALARGGAVFFDVVGEPNLTMAHCTVWDNSAIQTGGGVYAFRGTASIANSVLYANSAALGTTLDKQFAASAQGVRNARYSCIEGSAAQGAPSLGPMNFGNAPGFADPLGPDNVPGTGDEDFTPGDGSPLLDAGEDDSIPPDVLDLNADGNTEESVPFDLLGAVRAVPCIPPGQPPSASLLGADIGAKEAIHGCLSDFNNDQVVDSDDLAIILGGFGSPAGAEAGDANGDGIVDSNDLAIILGEFGSVCDD
ncbi:MAG: dockerin type I domain-containing protein [Phycisphaerales bacterium]